jgi:hypothetical protein
MVTWQVPVPVQAPLQPAKVESPFAAAVSVTVESSLNSFEHVAPQSMPEGELVTVPVPVPAGATVSVWVIKVKVAVTEISEVRFTWHVPVPLQPPPDQPAKVDPEAGVAVRVTWVPVANCAEQVVPQSIPAGLLVTVPLPLAAGVTVRMGLTAALKVAVTVVLAFNVT